MERKSEETLDGLKSLRSNSNGEKKMGIELRKITKDNFDECIRLKVHSEQEKFVANNCYSLAETYLILSNGDYTSPYAIYADDIMVGFIFYNYFIDEPLFSPNCYHIYRIMFDKEYQGKGYGKQTVKKIIEEIETMPFGFAEYIYVSYEPENIASKNLFTSFGFEPTDKKFSEDDNEIIARRRI